MVNENKVRIQDLMNCQFQNVIHLDYIMIEFFICDIKKFPRLMLEGCGTWT